MFDTHPGREGSELAVTRPLSDIRGYDPHTRSTDEDVGVMAVARPTPFLATSVCAHNRMHLDLFSQTHMDS